MSFVVAVDSGGTFTDCVVLDDAGGATRAKASSTPPRFEDGVLEAVRVAAEGRGMSLEELLEQTTLFAHGTTVATNILITRTGPRTALLTTRGHEDAILIGRTVQKVAGLTESEIIDVARLRKAEPIVPRWRIFGVDERVDRSGTTVAPLNREGLEDLVARLRDEGIESVAISFLWSFLHPDHERDVAAWLEEATSGNGNGHGGADGHERLFVTTSSELSPVIREYERTSTTVLNAYLTPGVNGYLERMRTRLRDAGHRGPITVMHSAGGVSSIEEARRRGVMLLSSGPAGGMLGTRALAGALGMDEVIATDVGGTSFDIGLLVDGEPSYAEAPVFEQYPVTVPVIDVPSIGAGGGSIAWIEEATGVLRVGPQSAGASPGPACYRRGGVEPTVTDANVVLGRIDPGYFLGGRLELDRELAEQAVARVAEPLGMTTEAAAAAIIEIVNAQMADLIRKVTVERGVDPARFAVFGYGGAAGMHVDAYASRLGCREVVVPRSAAVFSAHGIALSDVKRVSIVSEPSRAPFDLRRWAEIFEGLSASLRGDLEREGLPIADLAVKQSVELQFRGQVHALRVPVDAEDLTADDGGDAIIERFARLYEERYGPGTAYVQAGVEALSFVAEGTAHLPLPPMEELPEEGPDASAARRGERSVYFQETGAWQPVPVYAADGLRPGNRLEGPALVDAVDTTVLVQAGHVLWVDPLLNLRIDLRTA